MKSSALLVVCFLLALAVPRNASAQLGGLFGSKTSLPTISAEELRKMQTEQAAAEEQAEQEGQPTPVPSYVVVDVRTPAEYSVSVIPGAITAEQFEKDKGDYRGRKVIPYCTSGYRSERYSRKLLEQGESEVINFQGSILGWCAAGYPLETLERKPTNKVHTHGNQSKVPSQYNAVQ